MLRKKRPGLDGLEGKQQSGAAQDHCQPERYQGRQGQQSAHDRIIGEFRHQDQREHDQHAKGQKSGILQGTRHQPVTVTSGRPCAGPFDEQVRDWIDLNEDSGQTAASGKRHGGQESIAGVEEIRGVAEPSAIGHPEQADGRPARHRNRMENGMRKDREQKCQADEILQQARGADFRAGDLPSNGRNRGHHEGSPRARHPSGGKPADRDEKSPARPVRRQMEDLPNQGYAADEDQRREAGRKIRQASSTPCGCKRREPMAGGNQNGDAPPSLSDLGIAPQFAAIKAKTARATQIIPIPASAMGNRDWPSSRSCSLRIAVAAKELTQPFATQASRSSFRRRL
ncbi:hypothetical protein QW131_03540 [Roseibium salinum]|nr:hypothetical protein [Roseibium salinum]